MINELITGYYVENFYQINGKAHEKLSVRLNQENLQDAFANAMKDIEKIIKDQLEVQKDSEK